MTGDKNAKGPGRGTRNPRLETRNCRRWYLGLGSNVGDREAMVAQALERLEATEGLHVVRTSSLYETAPWGEADQGPFLNLVALVHSSLEALTLLAEVKRIERELGRQPRARWGPREIDIDLLLSDDLQWETPELTLPHPLLAARAFVVIPLAELDPDLRLPDGRSVGDLVRADDGVRLWKAAENVNGPDHRQEDTE